jgi:hypothetical protein
MNLKEIERKAFRSFFQDGLWDIFLGVLMILMGLGPWLGGKMESGEIKFASVAVIMGILILIALAAVLGFNLAKKYITTPRLGMAHFSAPRRRKIKNLRVVLYAAAVIGLIIFIAVLVAADRLPTWMIPAGVFTLVCLASFSLGAYYLDFPRLHLYGVFFGFAFPVNIWLNELFNMATFLYVYGALACVMIVIGLVYFFRFLKKYPLHRMEETNGAV